ncbi:hypothetical protein Dsin_024440 [Dipteronia sinensis]|uniref:Reverse transcriptase domain-containing protein n=1 Tax=Dipteronia sinensis TaxID=43782 RepID=A0AAD9ZTS5_9ROSI|nr:hypothetical protein Dsin_024440 [Dipteronia sinensis]
MRCVSSVTYSFVINVEVCGMLKPTKGLGQGDSLSPYPLLICAEGLLSLLNKAHDEGLVTGFKPSMFGPFITHMFNADDSLIFSKATLEDCAVAYHEKYLSLLTFVGKDKIKLLVVIVDRIWNRLKVKSSNSFLWKSLFWGRGLLENGLHWRIGDGALVAIYKDMWISRLSTLQLTSSPVLVDNAVVKHLILPSGGWDVGLISSSFNEEDSASILCLQVFFGSMTSMVLTRSDMSLNETATWCSTYISYYQDATGHQKRVIGSVASKLIRCCACGCGYCYSGLRGLCDGSANCSNLFSSVGGSCCNSQRNSVCARYMFVF